MPNVSKFDHDKAMVICNMHNDEDCKLKLNIEELRSLNCILTAYLCCDPDSCTELDIRELQRLKTENNI